MVTAHEQQGSEVNPTEEQQHAIDMFLEGQDMVIQACAGAGKTTLLKMMGEASDRRGRYTAFNKIIVEDAKKKMPDNVEVSTIHSLAFRSVGHAFGERLRAPRQKSYEIANLLDIPSLNIDLGGQPKRLASGFLAGVVMKALDNFCRSADPDPTVRHFSYIDGIDSPFADGQRSYTNNNYVQKEMLPYLQKAWRDVSVPRGHLRGDHCQPHGTLVRRVLRRGSNNRHTGESWPTTWEDVPIQDIQEGDRVISWRNETPSGTLKRMGTVVQSGHAVISIADRPYEGDLIVISTPSGRSSSYTPDHRCIVRRDADLSNGNFLVYLARRGDNFRIGRTTWRTKSQGNSMGIVRRAWSQKADAMWVLSVHASDEDAALNEALLAHKYGIPTWQFVSKNPVMPCEKFWEVVGGNHLPARVCLEDHGRLMEYPIWSRDTDWSSRRPVEMRACNLLEGMLVLEPDNIKPTKPNLLRAYDGSGGWSPISISRSPYSGKVYSIEVEQDHTYVADGIVTHNSHYLKVFQLSDPHIEADFLLLDEAQDVAPVMESIFRQQTHLQRIAVGDRNQEVYAWAGAINAMKQMEGKEAVLSKSFRFGPAVADVANQVLALLPEPMEISGHDAIESTIGEHETPKAFLARTNAAAVRRMFDEFDAGRRPHLLGGGKQVLAFARGARDLQNTGSTNFPELACFDSWGDVREYVASDQKGDELRLMVKLVDDFGYERIIEAVEGQLSEAKADIVLGTTHAVKGREWPIVQLAGDFPPQEKATPEENRLLYVAVTRAQDHLDHTRVPMFGGGK